MVRFNTLKNTIAASALGLATTLGGCTAKQGKTFFRNTNQLERTMLKDISLTTEQFEKMTTEQLEKYCDSIKQANRLPLPDSAEIRRVFEENIKLYQGFCDNIDSIIKNNKIDTTKWVESYTSKSKGINLHYLKSQINELLGLNK